MDLKSVLLSKVVIISLIIVCLFVSSVYFVGRWYLGINSPVVPRDAVIPTVQLSTPPPKTDESATSGTHETTETMPEATDAAPIDRIDDIAETFSPLNIDSQEETAGMAVSPFGFGPYPEVPAGFPEHLMPSWTWSDEKLQEHAGVLKNFELMGRVLVKLWNQGERGFVGVTRSDEDGKVFPLYPDIVYVDRWVELPVKNGKVALYPAGGLSGSRESLSSYLYPINFIESGGKLPPGIQFVDREIGGINPYEFLNLK